MMGECASLIQVKKQLDEISSSCLLGGPDGNSGALIPWQELVIDLNKSLSETVFQSCLVLELLRPSSNFCRDGMPYEIPSLPVVSDG
jgi:hypothetical protein